MRIRIWISGDEGPWHDFELLEAPRIGDHIVITVEDRVEEGLVNRVTWQLQSIDAPAGALKLEGEPVGAVTLVHVVCGPSKTQGLPLRRASAEMSRALAS